MLTLDIRQTTVLKQSTGQARTLPATAKRTIVAGKYPIESCVPSAAGHYVVKFMNPLQADDPSKSYWSWWIYDDDRVEIPGELRSRFKVLKVRYASQTDNRFQPHRTCNTSSCWMLLNYLRPGARATDDEYWRLDVNPNGDTTDHAVQTLALAKHGIRSKFVYDLDFSDLYQQIDRGYPVVIGILHRGPQSAPAGGHMIVVVGYDGDTWICHDPFGVLPYTDYRSGEGVRYSSSMLAARWLADGPRTGWGRIVEGLS